MEISQKLVAFSEYMNFNFTFKQIANEGKNMLVQFIYSEKATQFCEISTVDLSYVITVKFTVEILQNFVAFSEYMNFNHNFLYHKKIAKVECQSMTPLCN